MRGWILAIFLTLMGHFANGEVPSIVSHFYIGHPNDEGKVERKNAIASMFVIRPISITAKPKALMGKGWAENREKAKSLRQVFRKGIEQEYRNYGVLKGEIGPEIAEDLDTILKRKASVIAVTDPDHPERIQQIISLAYDGPDGLPMERRFKQVLFQREKPTWKLSETRHIEGWDSLYEVPLNSLLLSVTPHLESEIAELKTFIRGKHCTTDWIPFIFRSLLSMELLRNGTTPIEKYGKPDLRKLAPEIERKLAEAEPFLLELARGDRRRANSLKEMIRARAYGPPTQRTIGISQIKGEVHGDKLVAVYGQDYGFEDTGIVFPRGENRDDWVHVISISREKLETHTIDHLDHRPGLSLALDTSFQPVDTELVGQQPCTLVYSQLGTDLAPALGTRGTILGAGFQLW